MEFDFSGVDSLDKVPADFRPLYNAEPGEDGTFTVSETFQGVAKSISGFNKTLREVRQGIKDKKIDLSPLSEFGTNPHEIKEAFSTRFTELEDTYKKGQNSDTAKQIAAVKAAMQAAHDKEAAGMAAKNEGLTNQLYKLLVENKATSAIAEEKGTTELLMPFIKTQVKAIEEDGQIQAYVYDDAKNIRYGNTGSPMTVKELVLEMKGNTKYAPLFESQQLPGGGSRPGAPKIPMAKNQELTSNQKIAAGLAARQR